MYKLEISIKGLPLTINRLGRAHWTKKALEARTWRDLVVAACKSKRPPKPLTKAKVTLIRHSSHQPDADGLASSFKHPLDGLVDAKIIIDDKPSVIGCPSYLWQRCAPGRGYVEIIVEGC